MKVLLAIIVAVLVLDGISLPSLDVFGWSMSFSHNAFEFFSHGITSIILSVFLFTLIFFVMFAVIGSIAFAIAVGAIGLLIAGLSLFWPLVLVVVILVCYRRRPVRLTS